LVAIAAVAVVVLLGGLVYYLTSLDNSEVVEPAPNAFELPGEFEILSPGAYFADTDGPGPSTVRGTFVIETGGWAGLEVGAVKDSTGGSNDVSLFVVQVTKVASPGCDQTEWVPAATTAEGLAEQFATLPGFVITEGLAPAVAFGHEGYHMVVGPPAEGFVAGEGYSGCDGGEGGVFNVWTDSVWDERYYQTPEQTIELWFLDVEGTPVLVEATRSASSAEADIAELEVVLDTLVITP
jgi:hypothetical protein